MKLDLYLVVLFIGGHDILLPYLIKLKSFRLSVSSEVWATVVETKGVN